jgi:prepilin-type N-terminal cleavage/methylation domain-containing protein
VRPPESAAGRAGFTLIELLIVVTIIGILATIATSKVTALRQRALVASMQSDLRAFATAQEAYSAEQGRYGNLSDLQSAPHDFALSQGTTGMGRGGTRAWYLELTHIGVSDPRTDVCHMSLGTGNPDDGRPVCD